MAEQQSWKDIRNQRRKENFVGRGDEVRAFTENFATPPKYMIFAVTGEGGVGKSTLSKRFEGVATAPDIDAIVITCDDRQASPVAVMGHVANELSKLGISNKEFSERYKTYLQLRQEIESDPKVPRSAVKVISMGITDFTIKSLRKTPGVGVFFEYADEKTVGEALGEAIQYGINKWGNKDEVQLLREPESVLTPLFLKLIQKACEKRRLVIMVDVFERTGDLLSSWLLALFNFEYGEFGTKLSFVISGRDPLDQQWTDLAGMICYMRLEPFTPEETKLFLSNQGIVDEQLANQICDDTGGLPVLVELLAATKPQSGIDLPDISKDAVERFLQWTPQEERRTAALLAAVPRQFNRDILGAVLDDKANEMFNWLAGQSYIRRTKERGWFYHEKVRELMLRYIQKITPSKLANVHSKLSEYFVTSQTELKFTQEDGYKSEAWCDLEIERVYHLLSAHPEPNNPDALSSFFHAFRWKWQFADKIARIYQQVAIEKELKILQAWSDTLLELYLAYEHGDFQKAVEKLNQFEQQGKLTTPAQSCLFARRGEVYRMMNKYEESLSDFNRAIELDEAYSWAIVHRSQTYRQMEKFEEALTDLDRAIKLNDKDILAIIWRGITYRQLKRYEETLTEFNRAIDLDEKYSWAFVERGITYRLLGNHEKELTDISHAIELDEKYAYAIAQRGITYQIMNKFDESLIDFNRAIELNYRYIWVFANRGFTFRLMGKYDVALADFNHVLELNEKDIWSINQRGNIYSRMGKYEEALADFNHAIELNDEYTPAITSRAMTYRLIGRRPESLSDFQRAFELDPQTPSLIGNYAGSLLGNGYFDEGLAMLENALENLPATNPELASELWFYSFTHRPAKRRPEALKNLKEILQMGGRSPEWDFSENIAQARKDKHPKIKWVQKLADVITNKADISILDEWPDWKKA